MNVDPRVRQVFARSISPEVALQLTPDSTTDDVDGWDSHSFVAIVMDLEETFGITLSALEAARLQSVRAIHDLLVARGITLTS